jgi:hypothetical protein
MSEKGFKVVLLESDDDKHAELRLPFAPFPGLWLQVPWRGGDFAELTDVYWSGTDGWFEVFIESPIDEEPVKAARQRRTPRRKRRS